MWYVIPVNPDPWAIGALGVGKRNGKFFPTVAPNPQLVAYKDAVREELEKQNVAMLPAGEYQIKLFFWRQLDSHASGRKNIADATNLQKATEDAVQKVLIDNDRGVVDIRSRVVEQSPETVGRVVMYVAPADPFDPNEIPNSVWEIVDSASSPTLFDNTWPPS